jgi:branched-chain amino acid transport system substrate-binding protein
MKHTYHWNQAIRPALRSGAALALLVTALAVFAMVAPGSAQAQKTVKIGASFFLSGGSAGPFGIPARNGMDLMVEAINKGTLPAPYNTGKGLAGAMIAPKYIDEGGGATKQVIEFRNFALRDKMDVVIGYISSGNCIAIAPVADELKMLTMIPICGTPRLFEDAKYKYVFRTISSSITDSVAAAHYINARFPGIKTMGAINPNYAWGQDSWRDFHLAMSTIKPGIKIVTEQWPKLYAGQFSTEITVLLRKKPGVTHTALWGGDIESFVNQLGVRGLHKKTKIVLTTGETVMYRLGSKVPDGLIVGARGAYGGNAHDTALNRWFRKAYFAKFSSHPVYPSYMTAQSMLALKIAYDKAAKKKGGFPNTEEVIAAMEYLKFEAFGTTINLSHGNGHQAATESAYGISKFDKSTGTPTLTDVKWFKAACVNAPVGVKGAEWIKGGMKGAKCD